ncbi:extracellular solute-binding protein [Paenibacillus doosanensis]|uniref:Lipoprotein LipO n=1 Tax=Paenibacillus konkukensis TaxID=2020716 RepID=A0ABY4S1Y6_9BACL|nr:MULTISPECIES: extracellular solute-binding protein [Paenibacillus]MCS7463349.1 extracellular solute-binding protein [Paenibacillus doosanensis]UQZ87656.1 Lipoprotein LipO precursor [Paenibacillus konkukensis]
MMKMKKKRAAAAAIGIAMLATAFAGCSSSGSKPEAAGTGSGGGAQKEEPYKFSVMMKSFQNDAITSESKIWKQVEEYTNTKLEVLFTPDAAYGDKLNITLASGSMPSVIFTANAKLPSIVNAIKGGAFWEIGPYLKDYPNLRQMNETILNNTSVNGKTYGLYTARPLGRFAISYRKDWLQAVGMSEPKTTDDFYNMLKAFKEKDPDKNGKDDTYGMVVTKYSGPWDIMSTWFGAPNKWGIDKDGKLVPAHLTPEYMDSLKYFKKLYDEKLINQDFAVYDSAKWNDPIINGQAGVAVDVVDRSYQIDEKMKAGNVKGEMDVIAAINGPKGAPVTPATTGYGGIFLISKSAVKTEADLRKVLNFFDKIDDKDMQILITYGIEGTHYKVEDGKLVTILSSDSPQAPDINIKSFNQLLIGVPNVLDTAFKAGTPLRAKANEVKAANEKIALPNPGEPLISQTYTQKGAQLDQQVEDARVKFIVGKIDEAGFQAEMELWKKNGGNEYIKEMNDAYAESKKK